MPPTCAGATRPKSAAIELPRELTRRERHRPASRWTHNLHRPAGTARPTRARPARPGILPARPAATAAPTARLPAAPRRSLRSSLLFESPRRFPPDLLPASSALGGQPATLRYGMHPAYRRNRTRQASGHHESKVFSL